MRVSRRLNRRVKRGSRDRSPWTSALRLEALEDRVLLSGGLLHPIDVETPDPGAASAGVEAPAQTGEIRGTVWDDLDGDGNADAGETGLESWRVYIDQNGNAQWDDGESSDWTDGDGQYAIGGLSPGTRYVAEVVQAGWAQTYPDSGAQAGLPAASVTPDSVEAMVMDSGPVPMGNVTEYVVSDLAQSAVFLTEVPTSSWTYGCSATSAGMMFGYYDRTGYSNMYTGPANGGVAPLSSLGQGIGSPIAGSSSIIATQNGFDGRTTAGHVDDYWVSSGSGGPDPWVGSGTEHVWGDCTADYMGTNQWKWDRNGDGSIEYNIDGATTLYTYYSATPLYDYVPPTGDGLPRTALTHGLRLFAESRGYTVIENYTQRTDNVASGGFSFSDYQAQIDAGRPVMVQVVGHSMVGVGYDAAAQTVYLHDTWGDYVAQMAWGGSYAGMSMFAATVLELNTINTPDLVGLSFNSAEPLSWGQSFEVTGRVLNAGLGTAGASQVTFYMSSDDTITDGDYELGSSAIGSLGPLESRSLGRTLTLPATPPAGFTADDSVWIGIIVDAADEVTESNESNNSNLGYWNDLDAVTVSTTEPDLIAMSFNSQEPLYWGESFTVTGRVENQGTATAGGSTARIYASTDGTITSGDYELGQVSIGSLAPGAASTLSESLTLPSPPPAGFTSTDLIHIGIIVDAGGEVTESSESNNSNQGYWNDMDAVLVLPTPEPDLLGVAFNSEEPLYWGESFDVSGWVFNLGLGTASASQVKFYLSSDQTITDSDVELGATAIGSLSPGDSSSLSRRLTMPATPPAGFTSSDDVWIGIMVDADGEVTESSESNNSNLGYWNDMDAVTAVTAEPDLIAVSFNSEEPLFWSESFDVIGRIQNQGLASAGSSTARFYASADSTITSGDVALGSLAIGGLAPGADTGIAATFTLPSTVPAGFSATDNIWIGVIVDADDAVSEGNEANNSNLGYWNDLDAVLVFPAREPDLIALGFNADEPLQWGQTFSIRGAVINQGLGTAGGSTARFYASADSSITGGDVELGSAAISGLSPGAIDSLAGTLTLPSTVPAGFTPNDDIWIAVIVDADDAVSEGNEVNNSNLGYWNDMDAVTVSPAAPASQIVDASAGRQRLAADRISLPGADAGHLAAGQVAPDAVAPRSPRRLLPADWLAGFTATADRLGAIISPAHWNGPDADSGASLDSPFDPDILAGCVPVEADGWLSELLAEDDGLVSATDAWFRDGPGS